MHSPCLNNLKAYSKETHHFKFAVVLGSWKQYIDVSLLEEFDIEVVSLAQFFPDLFWRDEFGHDLRELLNSNTDKIANIDELANCMEERQCPCHHIRF